MDTFKLVADLPDLALEALRISDGQESGLFTLEIGTTVSYGLCTVNLNNHCVFLWDFGCAGKQEWGVYHEAPAQGRFSVFKNGILTSCGAARLGVSCLAVVCWNSTRKSRHLNG